MQTKEEIKFDTNMIAPVCVAFAIGFFFASLNAQLLPFGNHELAAIYLQSSFVGFLFTTMFALKIKPAAMLGMLVSFALLIAGFLADENVIIPFYYLPNRSMDLDVRIFLIVLGAAGAIRCWYNYRKPTKEIGKAETALEFMNSFFD